MATVDSGSFVGAALMDGLSVVVTRAESVVGRRKRISVMGCKCCCAALTSTGALVV